MTDISEPAGRAISVTIKYGKGYEETWAVFRGLPREVREDIIAYFGLDETDGLTLSEVVVNATQLAHGKGLVASRLGGTAVSSGPGGASGSDVWAAAESGSESPSGASQGPSEEDKTKARVLGLIEGVTKVGDEVIAELKRVWAENQSAFSLPGVMDAYKAKGKALKSG